MNKHVIATIAVLAMGILTVAYAQDAPYTGDVEVYSGSVGNNLLDAMLTKAKSHFSSTGSERIWFGYGLTVRDKFKSVYSHNFSSGHYRGTIISGFRYNSHNDDVERIGSENKSLLYQFEKGKNGAFLRRVSVIDRDDRYKFKIKLVWFPGVSEAHSIRMLREAIDRTSFKKAWDDCFVALALHKDKQATDILRTFVLSDEDEDEREDALMWYGFAILPEGFDELQKVGAQLKHPELREELTFLYHRVDNEKATRLLFDMARNDRDEDVREQAIFWLGQKANKKLARDMGIDEDDYNEDEVKKHAVFALSQMDTAKSREALLRVAKTGKSYSIRKAALFWLSQEGDPRVVDYLEEVLLARKR